MVRLFTRLWYMIVGEPSHIKAVKSINKALVKLETAASFQEAKSEAMALAAKAAAEASEVAKEAAQKAARVKEKLADLFEV